MADLSRVDLPLFGLSGSSVIPLEKINLPVTLGEWPDQRTQIIEFFVVESVTAYNSIFGRPLISAFEAISSSYYLTMKFPTLSGIGKVQGKQKFA